MTTAKMNKEQMVQFLDEHFNEVTDKNLQERITYTANAWKKDHDSVKLSDLRPLVKEVEALLPEEESKPAPANSTKKTLKKSSKKEEPKTEETAPKEEKKAPAKKPVAKKSEKKSAVQKSEQKGTNFDLAGMFEETITTEIGTLTKAQDIKTFADLRKALENEEEIYFAIYWTERLLRQFDYVGTIETVKKPKNFPNDLDLVSCIYLSDEDKLAVGISSYTDMPYIIQPKDMTITEDGFRYTSNMEFELYRLTDAVE
jgi:hypothetical protein